MAHFHLLVILGVLSYGILCRPLFAGTVLSSAAPQPLLPLLFASQEIEVSSLIDSEGSPVALLVAYQHHDMKRFWSRIEGGGWEDRFALSARGGVHIPLGGMVDLGGGLFGEATGERTLSRAGTGLYFREVRSGSELFLSLNFTFLFLALAAGIGVGEIKWLGGEPPLRATRTFFSSRFGVRYGKVLLGTTLGKSKYSKYPTILEAPRAGGGVFCGILFEP